MKYQCFPRPGNNTLLMHTGLLLEVTSNRFFTRSHLPCSRICEPILGSQTSHFSTHYGDFYQSLNFLILIMFCSTRNGHFSCLSFSRVFLLLINPKYCLKDNSRDFTNLAKFSKGKQVVFLSIAHPVHTHTHTQCFNRFTVQWQSSKI